MDHCAPRPPRVGEWGPRATPGRESLRRWVREFEGTGSVRGAARRHRGPQTRPADLARVRRAAQRRLRLSVRQLSAKTGVSRSTIHDILGRQLWLFPYKMQLRQRLHHGDKAKRMSFRHWFLDKRGSPRFRQHLLNSDEAHLNGCANKLNCRV